MMTAKTYKRAILREIVELIEKAGPDGYVGNDIDGYLPRNISGCDVSKPEIAQLVADHFEFLEDKGFIKTKNSPAVYVGYLTAEFTPWGKQNQRLITNKIN